ncbi:AraC family transcriptional regulator [Nocardioides sp. S-58]|uniref:AraC family transcriptional regulator n=1 Tax=Nocardioides renjunii TaxID=3095075 RepID=A0ABU5K604_9ACTN|nr:AraC family transcriptional regulator [Nocardioides sp. S-58]MDZ5660396.1 AraC family transcriptional regulator [Nocardioides sp. S-58]
MPRPEVDYDALSGAVSDAYFPHRLTVQRERPGPDATLRAVALGSVRLARIGWGSDVAVESDHPGAWAVNVPRSGVLEARLGERHVLSVDGQATVCPPDVRTSMTHWSADCSILGMRVERDYLDKEVATLVGSSTRAMPQQLDLRGGAGLMWLTLVSSIGAEALRRPELVGDDPVARRLGATLTAALVMACYPEDVDRHSLQPRIVTRVVDALEADPSRQWTASDLAGIAGVGIRRLQQGFREHRGAAPLTVLHEIRLDRVHADLVAGGTTVAAAAHRWGFTHLGRFAAAYRDRFGVSPSQTLRS